MFLRKNVSVFLKEMVPHSAYFFASTSISFKNDLSLVDISTNFSETLNIIDWVAIWQIYPAVLIFIAKLRYFQSFYFLGFKCLFSLSILTVTFVVIAEILMSLVKLPW